MSERLSRLRVLISMTTIQIRFQADHLKTERGAVRSRCPSTHRPSGGAPNRSSAELRHYSLLKPRPVATGALAELSFESQAESCF